jgi:predicted enzyme related to lactoylglutathione lyase
VAYSGPGGLTYVALIRQQLEGPTDDKPAVTLETPRDPDRVSSFLNIRVKDIAAVYAEWSARGAQFLTPPKQHQYEIRCYIRDPDGHLIEVGQLASLTVGTSLGGAARGRGGMVPLRQVSTLRCVYQGRRGTVIVTTPPCRFPTLSEAL